MSGKKTKIEEEKTTLRKRGAYSYANTSFVWIVILEMSS